MKLVGGSLKGYVLDGYGALHKFNSASTPNVSAYWSGWDIAKKFGINDAGTQGYVLDGFGGLHPFSTGSASKPPTPTNNAYWPGWNIARSIALSPDGKQGFVLDGFGGISGFSQPGTCKPVANASFYTPGADLSVDIAVRQWNGCSASRGHTVDAGGGIHDF